MRSSLLAAALVSLVLVPGCAEGPAPCARGTHREGDRCVDDRMDAGRRDAGAIEEEDAGIEPDDDAGIEPDDDAGIVDIDAPPIDDAGIAVGDDAGTPPAPTDAGTPPPTFPRTIDHLSFAIRTGSGTNAGADGTTVELCLSASRCFPLNVPDVNDFRRGEMDVYHFEDVAMPRANVDRVELRWTGGTDAWQPACVEVRFDGEPVHCNDDMGVVIGNGSGERPRWSDPGGLHEECGTCYPARVTHGPLVGAIGPNDARILVRTDATRAVTLRVAPTAGGTARVYGPQYPNPRDDYTTTFVVDGLSPRTQYTANVLVGGTRIGRAATFHTTPRDGVASAFRVGLGSCANNTNFPVQPVFHEIESRSPDLFLFLGDNHYANTSSVQALWWNYRETLEMPARASMLASTPSIAIWDDHDYVGNNTTRHSAGRSAALRAFTDYWANPSFGTATQPGVFFQTSYGDVDFFMLDTRYERDRPGASGGSITGDAQRRWLENALMRSTATFRIIASGSIFSRGGGETWLDYPDSRSRLFSFIRANDIRGVVFLAGDIHRSHFRRIHREHYDIPELVASGLATHSGGTCPGRDAAEPDASQQFCTQASPSFMQLDIDTTRADPRIVARLINGAGAELGTTTILRSQLR